jgi:hypothetical protein
MFGTGIRGFAIITAAISCGTYAIVCVLLHGSLICAVMAQTVRFLLFWQLPRLWNAFKAPTEIIHSKLTARSSRQSPQLATADVAPGEAERMGTAENETTVPITRTATSPGKGQEKENSTEEEVTAASEQSLAKEKTSLITRFRRNNARGPDRGLSEMEEGAGVLRC